VAFSGIPRIQDFPLLPQPLAGYLGLRAHRLNAATQAFMKAKAPASWRFVNLDAPLEPGHLAVDGFHPNELSCRVWCDAVLDAIRA
jgi:lysophospholipase L1-like esterase